jgi:hypothetical protein
VAACLDIPAATVRTRYFRARALPRETLERELDLVSADAFGFAGARCDRIVAAVPTLVSAPPRSGPVPATRQTISCCARGGAVRSITIRGFPP